jgi:hypothetical protein
MRILLAAVCCTCIAVAASYVRAAGVIRADGEEVLHVVADRSAHVLSMPDLRQLASTRDGGAWALSARHLARISRDGRELSRVDLTANAFGHGVVLTVDPYDDSAWIGTDAALLLHFEDAGAPVYGTSLPAVVTALSVALDRSPWFIAGGELSRLAREAPSLEPMTFARSSAIVPIRFAVDSLRDQAWIVDAHGLHRMTAIRSAMAAEIAVRAGAPRAIALDLRSGDLWAVVETMLSAFDRDGRLRFEIAVPVLANDDPVELHFDHDRASILLQTAGSLSTFSREGEALGTSALAPGWIVAAPAPLRIEPTLALTRPPAGAALYESFPELRFRFGAMCNGAPCALPADYADGLRITAEVNGVPMSDPVVDAANGYIVVTPRRPIRPGLNRLNAGAVDRFGHRADLAATFTVLEREPGAAASTVHTKTDDPSTVLKAANKAPTVALTSPASGATYSAGASVAIAATASDPDGAITKVDFFRGGSALIGTATSMPYEVVWPNVAAGTYSLTARAYDNRNGTATSAPVTIVVSNNLPPAVTLTSPAQGSFYAAGEPIPMAATATDPDGSITRIEFADGAAAIGSATSAPFAMTWTGATPGTHAIIARATDDRGGVGSSQSIDIMVGQRPIVVVRSPVPCSSVDGPTDLVLAADAFSPTGAIARVEFFDGAALAGTSFGDPWRVTLAGAAVGSHSITARAIDDRGLATTSRPSLVTVLAANQPPTVSLTAPSEGARFPLGSTVTVTANASDADGTVTAVEFRAGGPGGSLIGRATAAPYAMTWTNMAAGSHTLVAVAIDDRNATTTSAPVHVTIDANILPTVVLTAPSEGARFPVGSAVSLTANASDTDGAVAAVEFRLDGTGGTLIGRVTNAPYAVTWVDMAAGSYTLVAVAIDDRNAATTSAPVHVAIDANILPTVALTAPLANAMFSAPASVSLAADARDADGTIARVEFFAAGTLIGSSSTAPYTATWSNVAAGSYSLSARAIDNRGGAAVSPAVPVTVAGNAPPTVTLINTGGPYFAPATIVLGANAADGDGTIANVDFYANGVLIGGSAAAPYAMSWEDVAGGTYSVVAVATDNQGVATTSNAAAVMVNAAATIDPEPGLDGSVVGDDSVLVTGVVSAATNAGVLVNGMVAQVDAGGRFYVNGVPLLTGPNAVTITVVSQDGQIVTKSVNVSSSGPAPFSVEAHPTEGFAPLTVTFRIANRADVAFERLEFDFDGDGTADYTTSAAQFSEGALTLLESYPAGTFATRLTFYDSDDTVIQSTTRIVTARTLEQQDNLLRAVYDGMLANLRAGRLAAALSAITGDLHDKYGDVFAALGADLPAAVDSLGTLQANWYTSDHAEYLVVRDTPDGQQGFLIDFIRGQDGIWRIHGM